jgi:hypothetical protein
MFWDLQTWTLDLYIDSLLVWSDPAWAFPIRTDCVTNFLNVVAKDGTVRWNWHTPDLRLATSWLHDLIFLAVYSILPQQHWYMYFQNRT